MGAPCGSQPPGPTRAMAPVQRWRARTGSVLRALLLAAALHSLGRTLSSTGRRGQRLPTLAFLEPRTSPGQLASRPTRRQSLLLLSSAVAGYTQVAGSEPAQADFFGFGNKGNTKATEVIQASGNPKNGIRPYTFEKPGGFKKYANVVDPSGFLYRNTNDTYYSFVTRAEARPNASTEFKPTDFIADYEAKFTNSTGSNFTLLRGSPEPTRVDDKLGVKYYEVEYTVRTQLGFDFSSLRTLHFITLFAAAPESIYILNCQAQEDMWESNGPVLKKVVASFAING